MRSFSGLYFLLRMVVILVVTLIDSIPGVSLDESWFLQGIIFSLTALFIALCRPYKKTYMNVLDSLSLSHLATLCHIISSNSFIHYLAFVQMLILLPFVIFVLSLIIKLIHRTCRLRTMWSPVQFLTYLKVKRTGVTAQQLIQPTTAYGTMQI